MEKFYLFFNNCLISKTGWSLCPIAHKIYAMLHPTDFIN